MSLSNDYRPLYFKDVIGQKFPVKVLKSVVKTPERAMASYVLGGQYGTGKTTLARVFARELNGFASNLDIQESSYYFEFDCSQVGNVDDMSNIMDTLFYQMGSGWKVIVMDEAHLISKQAIQKFLKPLEDPPKNVFFFFVTTEPEKLLNTIKDRSMELQFNQISVEDLFGRLVYINEKEGFEIGFDVLEKISVRADGHARTAIKLLEFTTMFPDEAEDIVKLWLDELDIIFKTLDPEEAKKLVTELVAVPLFYLKTDIEHYTLKQVELSLTGEGLFQKNNSFMMTFFNYYVSNKKYAFSSCSDLHAFILILWNICFEFGRAKKKRSEQGGSKVIRFGKKGA